MTSGEHAESQPILENEPGVFQSTKWAIDEIFRKPGYRIDAAEHLECLDQLLDMDEWIDKEYEQLEIGRYAPQHISRRYWRDVAVIQACYANLPTNKADTDLAWKLSRDRSVLDLHKHLAMSVVGFELLKRKLPTSESEQKKREEQVAEKIENHFADVVKELSTPTKKNKDIQDRAGIAAIAAIDYAIAQIEEEPGPDDDGDIDYADYLDMLMTAHHLTILSGKKAVYDIMLDKLDKIDRLEKNKHHASDSFYKEMVDIINNDPFRLRNCIIRHGRLNVKAGGEYYIKKALILNIYNALFDARKHIAPLQATYRESLQQIIDSPLNTLADLTDKKISELNAEYAKENVEPEAEVATPEPAAEDDSSAFDVSEILRPMQLDWEILPPGELEAAAKDIVTKKTQRSKRPVEINLERLNILHEVREMWGVDRSYYALGSFSRRGVKSNTTREQPDEYIILVLQDVDHQGNIFAEHAVAESPIAGPHAVYVHRQDVTERNYTWREIMSLPKKEAREFGARAVKHTLSNGDSSGLNEIMRDKICMLLACTPEEFSAIEFKGNGRISVGRYAVLSSVETS